MNTRISCQLEARSVGEIVGTIRRGRPVSGTLYRRGGLWWIEVRGRGQRLRRSLGTSDRAEAEEGRRKVIAALTIRADVGAIVRDLLGLAAALPSLSGAPGLSPVSLASAADMVLAEARASGTQAEVVRVFAGRWQRIRAAAERRGATTLAGITPALARSIFLEDLAGATKRTRIEYHACLRRVLRSHGLCDPLEGVPMVGPEGKRRPVTIKELRRLLAVAEGEDRLLVLILAYTGLRLGDACRLRWRDFQKDTLVLCPRKTARRTGRVVRVPLHAALLKALPRRGRPDEPVLPEILRTYEHSGRWAVPRRLRAVFSAAGITTTVSAPGVKRRVAEVGAHSLRHFFVSQLAAANVEESVIMELAGHSAAATSRRYQHLDTGRLRSAVSRLPRL